MKLHGLFIRGIFRSVLNEILQAQSECSDFTAYLQPYAGAPIKILRDNLPTFGSPIRLYLSTSEQPATVSFTADIVGWKDKTALSDTEKCRIERIIEKYQPGEGGLYNYSKVPDKPSLNLVLIQRLIELPSSFCVTNLFKKSDGKPYSPDQASPGGWSEIRLV